jgi:hypothetical protein
MTGQSTDHQWYTARDGKQTGPMSDAEIKTIAGMGYFRDKDLVWRAGFADWQSALSVFPPQPVAPPLPAAPPPVPTPPAMRRPEAAPTQNLSTISPASGRRATEPTITQTPTHTPSNAAHPHAPREFDGNAHAYDASAEGFQQPTPITSFWPSQQVAQAAAMPIAPVDTAQQPIQRPHETYIPVQPDVADPVSRVERAEPAPLKPLFTPSTEPARLPLTLPRSPDQTARTQPPRDSRTAAPAQQPNASTGRPATAVQRTQSTPETEHVERPRSNKMAVAALCITIGAVAVGVWIAAGSTILAGLPNAGTVAKSLASIGGTSSAASDMEKQLQSTAHWPVIKKEFPDWYGERLREAAKLKSESKTDTEITKIMVDQMVALRRQNAALALSASTPKLKALATAFLNNLRQLKAQSTTQCFNFISQGEATPGVIELLQGASDKPQSLQLQVAAIFDAIGEGRTSPVVMGELGKLGWTQNDVATFADPKALARAEPARVCQMVQDWFSAHIAIADDGTQERLLGETLRPVVSG